MFSLVLCVFSVLFNTVVQKNVFMFGIGWLVVFVGNEEWRSLLRFRGSLAPEPTTFDYAVTGTTTLICLGIKSSQCGGTPQRSLRWTFVTRLLELSSQQRDRVWNGVERCGTVWNGVERCGTHTATPPRAEAALPEKVIALGARAT